MRNEHTRPIPIGISDHPAIRGCHGFHPDNTARGRIQGTDIGQEVALDSLGGL
jgi:hypothetical protein